MTPISEISWSRALLVWLLIIVLETIHGILRGLFLTPAVGDFRARQVGVFIGSGLILGVSCLTIRWMTAGARAPRGVLLRTGIVWTVLTLAFEFSLGTALGLTWSRMLSDYDLPHGGLMPLGILILVLAPWIAAKSRGIAD
ncbi:MAG: hypothetical protein ABL967_00135 [Bryobacteraceae bacterium]